MKLAYPTLANTVVAQGWGNHNPLRYPGSGRHMGIDLAGAFGVAVYAACPGVVDIANILGAHGYGRHVIIEHGDFKTLYAHLSRVHVMEGQTVEGGAVIGAIGGDPNDKDPIDGVSSGPHLHFEVLLPKQPDADTDSIKTVLGWTVDPFAYLLNRFGEAPKFKGRVLDKSGSRVRSSASTKFTNNVLYALKKDEAFDVMEVVSAEGDEWAVLKSLRAEFVCVVYQGKKLVELAPLSGPPVPEGTFPQIDPSKNTQDDLGGVSEREARLDELKKLRAWLDAREKELAPLSPNTGTSPQMEEHNLGGGKT